MGTRLWWWCLHSLVVSAMVWACTCGRRSGRNRDGSIVRYVQLAHNRRVDGVTQAEVLLNLGREDRLDPDGLRRLVGSINRYLGEADTAAMASSSAGDGLSIVTSRPMGVAWLLDGLWRQLGVDTALAKVLGGRRFTHRRGAGAVRVGREPGDRPDVEAGRRRSGRRTTSRSPGSSRWMRIRRIGRWTCSSPPTPRPRCKRRCSSPSPTC